MICCRPDYRLRFCNLSKNFIRVIGFTVVGLITACGFVTHGISRIRLQLQVVGLITACGFVTKLQLPPH